MRAKQLRVLEEILSYGIPAFIDSLKLRFASHHANDELLTQAISALIDKIDDELKDVPEQLFENSKLINDIYYKSVDNYEFDEPKQLFGITSNILDESFVLILRYAVIYEALQALPENYPLYQKQNLEESLRVIKEESEKFRLFSKRLIEYL